ncbi:hypothetical protein SAMN05428988_0111 [Chitinophaga sp. YR573]|nr:hypothetical protein SAMN05428988_0111 [Chitinophaga sp. YR573]
MIYLASALVLSAGLFITLMLQTKAEAIESRSKADSNEPNILFHNRRVSIEEMLSEIAHEMS